MEKRFKPFKQFKRQSGARKDCDQLLREPLRSACSRLGSFSVRFLGGAFVSSELRRLPEIAAISSTAARKAASLAFDGLLKPLTFLTNCNEAARISSSVTGGWKLKSVLMLLHIIVYLDVSEPGVPAA